MTQRLLRWVGPLHVLAGLALAACGFFEPLYVWMTNVVAVRADFIWSPFFASILGPTIASWGILFAYTVSTFYQAPSLVAWRAMLWSVLIWAPLDTALCFKFGFYGGAMLNAAVFLAVVALLISARRILK